ncbi:MAG: cytochrome P450 [Micrococcales bacterium]
MPAPQENPEIRGFDAVRSALKDYETYSSDLQGDRDVRDYKQLPLEVDPPRHTLFREATQPYFHSDYLVSLVPQFRLLASELLGKLKAGGEFEVGRDLALPYVIGCLTIVYKRPQDYSEWLSWGPDVWTAGAYAKSPADAPIHIEGPRSGAELQSYLDRVFDAAVANVVPVNGTDGGDIWDFVSQLVVAGQPVTRAEMQGIANVLLAGGRDTVIKLITGLLWHLIRSPEDRQYLMDNEAARPVAMAEMVRFLSPLPKMERIRTTDGQAVNVSFLSANYDPATFERPDEVDFHRGRTPHLGFGLGRHSCMGRNVTENEVGALLDVMLESWADWSLVTEPEIHWVMDGDIRYLSKFLRVPVISNSPQH